MVPEENSGRPIQSGRETKASPDGLDPAHWKTGTGSAGILDGYRPVWYIGGRWKTRKGPEVTRDETVDTLRVNGMSEGRAVNMVEKAWQYGSWDSPVFGVRVLVSNATMPVEYRIETIEKVSYDYR